MSTSQPSLAETERAYAAAVRAKDTAERVLSLARDSYRQACAAERRLARQLQKLLTALGAHAA